MLVTLNVSRWRNRSTGSRPAVQRHVRQGGEALAAKAFLPCHSVTPLPKKRGIWKSQAHLSFRTIPTFLVGTGWSPDQLRQLNDKKKQFFKIKNLQILIYIYILCLKKNGGTLSETSQSVVLPILGFCVFSL